MEQKRVESEYIHGAELPWTEGQHRGGDAHEADAAIRAGRWTLTGLALDHDFYNADLLQLTGVVAHPVDLFWAENNLPMQETPFRLESPRIVLHGLPTPSDHHVYACPKIHSPRLFAFLDRFAIGDPASTFWEAIHQTLQMVDWKLVESLTTAPVAPPTVPIHLYGLSGPDRVYHWGNPRNLWNQPIWLGMTSRKRINPGEKKKFAGRRRT